MTRTALPASRTSQPASLGNSTLSPGSTPVTSLPTAVSTPVRQSASADAGRISPRFVSDSSSDGWTTTKSSRGSRDRSMRLVSGSCTLVTLQPAGLDDALEELLGPGLLRLGGDLLRRPVLQDHPFVEEADPVRDVTGEAHLVGGDQHRHAARGQFADHLEHLRDELRIERARHLVEQHQVGAHCQCSDDCDPLLLATREAVRKVVPLVGEPEALEQLRRLCLRPRAGNAERKGRRQRHAPHRIYVREKVLRPENNTHTRADVVYVVAGGPDLFALDNDPAPVD